MEIPPLIGKKILITGASGFIGTRLCHRLSGTEVELHALSRVGQVRTQKNIRWWLGDVSDHAAVAALVRSIRPDYIISLASFVNGSRALSALLPTFQSNLMGQVYLMTEACKIGCLRFIAAGSMEEPHRSDTRHNASSPYAAAKMGASLYGRLFSDLYGFPYVSLRVFMVYGPGQMDPGKLIPYSILSMLRGESPNLSSGKRLIDWIYIDDVIDGILASISAPNLEGATLDIGSGTPLPISSILEMLTKLINPKVTPNYGALNDRVFEQEPVANVSETSARLGWKPRVSLQAGLIETVRWYKENMHRFDKAC